MYQIYPKSFKDTNHDGIGDIRGVIEQLSYLEYLGIDAIWLNPVYRSPMADNGYDISDFEAIAEEYGTMEDIETLIAEAKRRRISIVMDLVINHTSDEHPWFVESRMSKDSPRRDWYIWRDPREDGSPPTNWRSIFGGSAWEYDDHTGQYYLHVFANKQPDLNWENSDVRRALYKLVNFWLDKGIGGFRVDAITFIKKRQDFSDISSNSIDGLAPVAEVSLNQHGIHEFLHELRTCTFDKYDVFTVAEAPGVGPNDLPAYVGEGGAFSMLFEFGHVDLDLGQDGKWYQPEDWTLPDLKRVISESQSLVNRSGWSGLYLENHDLPRSVNKFLNYKCKGPEGAKLLATMYFLLRGTPFIYQGQELGMTNVKFSSIDEYNDIATIDQFTSAVRDGYTEGDALDRVSERSRDNSRTPMQWDDSLYAGFSTHTPWLGVNPNYLTINVEKQMADPDSVLHYYRRLINLRKNSDVILSGRYDLLLPNDDHIFVYSRTLDETTVLVILNFCDQNKEFCIPETLVFTEVRLLLGNYEVSHERDRRVFQLKPFEARVYELKGVLRGPLEDIKGDSLTLVKSSTADNLTTQP